EAGHVLGPRDFAGDLQADLHRGQGQDRADRTGRKLEFARESDLCARPRARRQEHHPRYLLSRQGGSVEYHPHLGGRLAQGHGYDLPELERLNVRVLAWGLILCALLAGCSNLKSYRSSGEKNMLVRVKNEGGGFFSSTRPDVNIFSVDAACETQYLGTVDLDAPRVEIGLPVGQT